MRRRRVLFVLANLGGGAARVMVTLLRHLDRTRFELHLVVVDTRYDWFRSEVPPDVTVHILKKRRLSRAVPRLLRAIWRVSPAIVVSTQGYVNFLLLASRPLFPRSKLVVREVVGERYLKNNRYRELLYGWYLRLVRHADRIVTQSDVVAREMEARVRARPGQVVRIHNPVDTDRLVCEGRAAPSPFTWSGPHLVAAGRLTYQKGFDILLDAFAGVRSEGVAAALTILGVGEDHAALEAQARRLGIADAVHLVGFQEQPHRWFAHADLFVLSSRYEGLPNVLLEALACGCPAVAFDCPHGVNEVVRGGQNGVLLPPEDGAALQRALVHLLRSPAERARLRASAAPTTAPFAASEIARQWDTLFDAITAV